MKVNVSLLPVEYVKTMYQCLPAVIEGAMLCSSMSVWQQTVGGMRAQRSHSASECCRSSEEWCGTGTILRVGALQKLPVSMGIDWGSAYKLKIHSIYGNIWYVLIDGITTSNILLFQIEKKNPNKQTKKKKLYS